MTHPAPDPAHAAAHLSHAYAVISATSAAQVDLIEAVRSASEEGGPLPAHMATSEIVENLADALQSAIAIEADDTDPDLERQQALGQLQAAVGLFLVGWAA